MLRGQTTRTSEPSTDATIREPGHHRVITTQIWIVLPILILSFVLVGLHLKAYRTFSPIDERQHVDYLYRISRGELLRMGEQIGQETLRDESCRGLDWNLFTPPPCHPNRPYDPNVYPDLGYNSAHVHPPTYYFFTNMVVKTFRTTGVASNFVSSARLVGGLWLGLGLLSFWYAGRELRIPLRNVAITLVLLATTPTLIHASSIVNPDATSLLAGSALLLAVLVWERRRGYAFLLLPASAVFAVGMKFTNMLAVGAAVIYLMLRWWHERQKGAIEPRARLGYLLGAAALVISSVATAALWMITHNLLILNPVNPQLESFQVDSLSGEAIVTQMMALVTPVRDAWLPSFLNNAGVKGVLQIVNLGLMAAAFGALLFEKHSRPTTLVAISGALVMLGSGAALTIGFFYLNSRAYVAIPPRYGISILPFLFLALASALRRSAVFWLVALLAVLSAFTVLSGLLSAR